MLRLSRQLFMCSTVRSWARHRKHNRNQLPLEDNKVKIISSDNEDNMKITFKYGQLPESQNVLSFRVAKHDSLNTMLEKIKVMVSVQKKKAELRRVAVTGLAGTSELLEISDDDDVKVSIIQQNRLVDGSTPNVNAWTEDAVLKIGDATYEINKNTPSVVELSLPDHIIPGTFIRPHIVVECARVEDCQFTWYRSTHEHNESSEDGVRWVKVSDGFTYATTPEDVGFKLKVVCTPMRSDDAGAAVSAMSKNNVEEGPAMFPFEKRHQHTRHLVDCDCIRCVSYNALANIYVETKKFPYSSRKARDVYYRKQVLLKELLGYNSDIICLQEIQERVFDFDLTPVMKKAGFQGFYLRKGGRTYEGLALFYRTSKFQVVHQQGVYLNEVVKDKKPVFNNLLTKVSGNYKDMSKTLAQDTALQIMLLEHVSQPRHKVLVANTHLYSNKNTPEVRLIQAALCIYYLEHILKSREDLDSTALIFCGDFNSLPGSAAYNFITSGSFECCNTWKTNSVAAKEEDTVLKHGLMLDSACGTPKYTNYTVEFSGCLDYIFYGVNNLHVTEVVPMPSHKFVTEQTALPSELFPSDHIALVCTLKWKNWNRGR